MKRLLVILVLIVSLGSVQAQQEPLLTQYYVNGLFYNPAVAGSKSDPVTPVPENVPPDGEPPVKVNVGV